MDSIRPPPQWCKAFPYNDHPSPPLPSYPIRDNGEYVPEEIKSTKGLRPYPYSTKKRTMRTHDPNHPNNPNEPIHRIDPIESIHERILPHVVVVVPSRMESIKNDYKIPLVIYSPSPMEEEEQSVAIVHPRRLTFHSQKRFHPYPKRIVP